MFPAAMDEQRRRSFRALARIARGAGEGAGGQDSAALDSYLQDLGRAHRKFGVRERHYDAFRQALMATLHKFAAERWDAAAREAWLAAFDHAASVMIEGARRDAAHFPAWWIGTVTAKEPRGPDLAVLTLRPDQPLSYLPGQYVSVQTPHWPRLWRRYSIANAPRPDGTLRLHVRAITGGLVSPTLVHHVRVGDPLVIGAPAGTMAADTALGPGRPVPGGRDRARPDQGDHRGDHPRARAGPAARDRALPRRAAAAGPLRPGRSAPDRGRLSRGCRSSPRSRMRRCRTSRPRTSCTAPCPSWPPWRPGRPGHLRQRAGRDDPPDGEGARRTRRPAPPGPLRPGRRYRLIAGAVVQIRGPPKQSQDLPRYRSGARAR